MINIVIEKSNKQSVCQESAYISFDFDMNILALIKALPIREYHQESKAWEIPATHLYLGLDKLNDYEINVEGINNPESIQEFDINFKTKPYPYQIEGVEYMLKIDNVLLGDDMGLGKTKQVIDTAIYRKENEGIKHCLIVCGVNDLKYNWRAEIEKHSNETGYILGTRYRKRSKKEYIGSINDRLDDLENLTNDFFIITNIETLRAKKDTGKTKKNYRGKEVKIHHYPIADKLEKLCNNNTISICAVDEIHKCFEYSTTIKTNQGDMLIGDLVKNQSMLKVASYNEITKQIEYKRIKNWFENKVNIKLIELTFNIDSKIVSIKCTPDHKFYTKNRGWVQAKNLNGFDDFIHI